VGIVINGISKFGVVHKPVTYNDPSVGETYFGSLECGGFRMSFDPSADETRRRGPIEHLTTFSNDEEVPEDKNIRVLYSGTLRNAEEVNAALQPFTLVEPGSTGLAGKLTRMYDEDIDAYVYPNVGMEYWDVAAPEPIFRGNFGVTHGCFVKKFTYDSEISAKLGVPGCIFARN
jgi:3'-phosphoadenosine 5'-phosphosulfate (PAPS) 3'-phosphatase